ncbi:MAG: SH3 domain-containing protein [Desulfuromonas thiophila]|nr:SH3 domain-containing protein [Desulfuromonas thiophila]
MSRYFFSLSGLAAAALGCVLAALLVWPAPASARAPEHRHSERHGFSGPARPDFGREVRRPPQGARRLHSPRYGVHYVHRGTFYRPLHHGYRVVRPPVGLVVNWLPTGYVMLNVAGLNYAYYDGIYYQPMASGYRVVEAPMTTLVTPTPPPPPPQRLPLPSQALGQVRVQVEMLNVRSGPSRLQPVVGHVTAGTSLVVLGTAPDWYYVQLPDGTYGWVWAQFVVGELRQP